MHSHERRCPDLTWVLIWLLVIVLTMLSSR